MSIALLLVAIAAASDGAPKESRKLATFGSAGPSATHAGNEADPFFWVLLTNWRDTDAEERRVGDVLRVGATIEVSVVASVPVVTDWIEIGGKRYHYCNGPGDVSPIVSKLLSVTTTALEKGVQSAAPKWSAVAVVVGGLIRKIPSLVERKRQSKWAQWRVGLQATENIGSRYWSHAMKSVEVCRYWKYAGVWNGKDVALPMTTAKESGAEIEIPWTDGKKGTKARIVSPCLAGEPPDVQIVGGQIHVRIARPDVTPPGACEARYDVAATVT